MGYKIISFASFALRVFICYITIETVPIFRDPLLAYAIGQIFSLYWILWFISYTIVGVGFGYRRGDDPVLGSILYAIVYIPLALITWGTLAILTWLGVLPI